VPQSSAPRILIVRLTAIGDVIHTIPVLSALRAALPDAYLGWVVEGRCGELLRGHACLDQMINVRRKWLRSPRAVRDLRRQLRDLNFDIAIDVQGLSKSAIAAKLSGAPRRIGYGGKDGREISQFLNNDLVEPAATHVIERNLQLLRALDIHDPQVDYGIREWDDDVRMIEQFLHRSELAGRFVLLHPGAGWPSKLWPTVRFAAVARYLAEERGLPSVVAWAGDTELALAQDIVAHAGGHARLAPATSLTELASLARRARIAVASDTGPLHLAVAVGTPSVGLFGPMAHERNGPYGPEHIAIQNARIHGGSRQRRRATNATMLAISVNEVCAACGTLLDRQNEHALVA
jgi:lipopolysaccharide heptosyltransferase I